MSDYSRFDSDSQSTNESVSQSTSQLENSSGSTKLPPPSLSQFAGNQQASRYNSNKPKRVRLPFVVVGVSTLFGLIGGISGTFVANEINFQGYGSKKSVTQLISPPIIVSTDGSQKVDSLIAKVALRLANSVVTITATLSDANGNGRAVGTGLVLTSNGEILTNAHVVEGATEVVVRFAGETEPRIAKVLATDVGNDLALIKVDATGLIVATFAKPGSVNIGDSVIAIGYALALDGGPTVTSGIVSAIKRTIETESGALNSLIQTDAAISSGNSGGPLVNLQGEVVGINTAVARGDSESAATNIGFSISVDEVLIVIEQLRAQANGVERLEGFLGVGLTGREDGGQGAIITDVRVGSPAEIAGIVVNDIVLSVDGEPIDGQAGLVAAIRDAVPGQKVKIEISRAGKRLSFEATLVARSN